MKNIEKIKEDISVYTQLLESHGVTKLYEGNTKNGNQVLMADGNSGVVFSIEYVPATHNVEIRTSSNQTEKFPTYEILNSLKDNCPLFSKFLVNSREALPLMSIVEEEQLPFVAPMSARLEILPGAPEDVTNIYYCCGTVPGISQDTLEKIEEQYLADEATRKTMIDEICESKLTYFPEVLIDFYPSEDAEYNMSNNNKSQVKKNYFI